MITQSQQQSHLLEILLQNKNISRILDAASVLGLPNWYLGAGCISQTFWNHEHGFDLNFGIIDYDVVYFDTDISEEKQIDKNQRLKELLPDLNVEVVNEARVHVWFKDMFGYEIDPYTSTEDAIDTWPTTATAVGVRKEGGDYIVYASFGLDDVLGMIVRANKKLITKEVYDKKVDRWKSVWPQLAVVPW